MLLWVLCLKLWWLALPLSTLQHPSKPQGQTAEQELEPRDAAITSNMANANLAMTLDPKLMASGSVVLTAAGQVPQDGSVPLLYRLNPLLIMYNYTGILVNQSSNNPFSYRGRDPYPAGPYPPSGRAPYPPDPYPPGPDPYPPGPDPYPPGPDPFSPSDPNVWSFDFAYPPWGTGRKLIVRFLPIEQSPRWKSTNASAGNQGGAEPEDVRLPARHYNPRVPSRNSQRQHGRRRVYQCQHRGSKRLPGHLHCGWESKGRGLDARRPASSFASTFLQEDSHVQHPTPPGTTSPASPAPGTPVAASTKPTRDVLSSSEDRLFWTGEHGVA